MTNVTLRVRLGPCQWATQAAAAASPTRSPSPIMAAASMMGLHFWHRVPARVLAYLLSLLSLLTLRWWWWATTGATPRLTSLVVDPKPGRPLAPNAAWDSDQCSWQPSFVKVCVDGHGPLSQKHGISESELESQKVDVDSDRIRFQSYVIPHWACQPAWLGVQIQSDLAGASTAS